jgi:hypothetical protein
MSSGLVVRGGVLGGALSESQANTRVLLAACGLALLGAVVLALTVWWWRGTRREPSALASLEVMSDRKFLAAAESDRQRLLTEHLARSHRATSGTAPVAGSGDPTLAAPSPHLFSTGDPTVAGGAPPVAGH